MSEAKDQVQYFLINTDIESYKKRNFKNWVDAGYAYLNPDSGSNQYRNTLEKLKVGNYIFAYDSAFEKIKGGIVGIGQVLDKWDGVLHKNVPHPDFVNNDGFYKVRVKWDPELSFSLDDMRLTGVTVPRGQSFYRIKDSAAEALVNSRNSTTTTATTVKKIIMQTDIPLNQILYGPPGTGKTFNTINEALAILDPDFLEANNNANSRPALKARFDELVQNRRIHFVTFHQSFSYEDFVEGLRADNDESGQLKYKVEDGVFKLLCDQARAPLETNDSPSGSAALGLDADKKLPYVLIIDEINRGNVSRIFGELITLIEDSKRSGQSEALEVVLPYSKNRFSVPDNVYIIGTMNTTDRSLAGMDVALRRRFSFTEMPPLPSELSGVMVAGVDIEKLLEIMNQRIEILLDRDHRLGHSYFLPLRYDNSMAKLNAIFRQQIWPLLQEYFFEDWERIHWVLNDHRKKDVATQFVKQADNNINTLFGEGPEISAENRRWQLNEDAFNKIQSYLRIIEA